MNAECACSYSGQDKICGILNGNGEYSTYVAATRQYYDHTTDCHNAHGLEAECQEGAKRQDAMCQKMRAKNFFSVYNAPACARYYSNPHTFPDLDEVEQWCSPGRTRELLQLSGGLMQRASLALLAIISIFALVA